MNNKIERFNESGKLSNSSTWIGNDLVKDAILFETGTHRGKPYTVRHLRALANSFKPEDDVPVQLDHSESAKDTVGFLESVQLVGNQLMGKLRIIDDTAKEKVHNGLMKKVSISFYTDKDGTPNKIREVSLVAFPQVKGAKLFSEQAQSRFEKFSAELDEKFNELDRQIDRLIGKPKRVEPTVVDHDAEYQAYMQRRGIN